MSDPAKAQGDEEAIHATFAETLAVLNGRISVLLKQFAAEPGMDAARLQELLGSIISE